MNALQQILKFLVNVAFTVFGGKIKGARTVIVNATAAIIAVWEFISTESLFEILCGLGSTVGFLEVFCNIQETTFWSIVIAIFGALNLILKKLDADELVGRLPGSLAHSAVMADLERRRHSYFIGGLVSVALLTVVLFANSLWYGLGPVVAVVGVILLAINIVSGLVYLLTK